MKILLDFNEKCFGILLRNKAYTIARHGRPFGNLWETGWSVSVLVNLMPYFGILKYQFLNEGKKRPTQEGE
jgi:hypothetical protein